jgi:hypothetical protein
MTSTEAIYVLWKFQKKQRKRKGQIVHLKNYPQGHEGE